MHEFDLRSLDELLARNVDSLFVRRDGSVSDSPTPRAIFPGAFNPFHDGHRRMAELAAKRLGAEVAFELSIANVDKPPLSSAIVAERLAQFSQDEFVWVTRAATFLEKARLFGPVTFIVGTDTIARIADSKYYHDRKSQRDDALVKIADLGCRFLVFGRTIDECFQTLPQLDLPATLQALCDGVDENVFRADISSSRLRDQM
jgi:hypothetical protein